MNLIIDFHTHPYLEDGQNLCVYENAVPHSPQEMKRQLTGFGITKICGSVLRKDRTFDLRGLNDSALRLRDLLGDFYLPGFHIHPAHVAQSIQEVDRMHAAGVHLIGELVPYMHGWGDFLSRPYTEEMHEILSVAESYRMVFSFHTTWEWPIDELIAAHPQLSFVAAHPGERESVDRHILRMQKFNNVFLDLSGTGIFRFGSIRHLFEAVGANRLLFGTDYPICNPQMYIHAVLGERLGSIVEDQIFHQNAERLLQ
jgi:predicted TIM-barrel fold metal-dependent hydrolase